MKQQKLTSYGKERMDLLDRIEQQNEEADRKYEQEQMEAQQEIEFAADDRIEQEEEAAEEKEWEDEQNRLENPDELFQTLKASPDDGGYSDVWEHAPTQQKIMDAVENAIAEGRPNDDIRTYTAVAENFREREKMLSSGDIDQNMVNREDVISQISAQEHREMLKNNEYAAEFPEPETPEQLQQRFAAENPDMNAETFGDTVKNVDASHREQYIKTGQIDNSYKTYSDAGEAAENEQYFRERRGE